MSSNINKFLDNFKSILLNEDSFKDDICRAILEKTSYQIDRNAVSFKDKNIFIEGDPYLKSEIGFKKDQIIEILKEKYPKKDIKNIF